MVTMFVVMSLAAVGLPMMNGFVGEFLILTGAMQSVATHHVLWTVIGTSGVIFSASYMLWMIQRVFYGALGYRPEEVAGWDLSAREHLELWPLAVLFLVMGLASPIWMKSIDMYGATTADKPQTFEPGHFKHIETETYGATTLPATALPQEAKK
jgi:NADH-quinone oxidoreductase subunit M